jgi:deoxyribodipyrimidine photo-lyase
VVQVESEVIVPVACASPRLETAARTLRPRIARCRERFLVPLAARGLACTAPPFRDQGLDLASPERLAARLSPGDGVAPVPRFFTGGYGEARARFDRFLRQGLPRFSALHNQPQEDLSSQMGPYLHFGQISPLELALAARDAPGVPDAEREAFLEQLIVRRELAVNFVHYHPHFATTACLPPWARQTLRVHALDPRPHHYTPAQLEAAATRDPYWNAAMTEMRLRGYLHNHLRMYWGKKILEWSPSPECALATILRLNNRYFLDGRDPNSYAGAAWILGMHDRAWPERPVFGKVRSMVAAGLERKCDIRAWVARVEALARSGA